MPPADVLTAYSSSRPRCRVSLAAFFKPFRRRGSSSGHGLFFGGDGRRWFEGGCRWSLLVASRAFGVVFVFFGVLCVRWVGQLCLYPPRTFLVSYEFLYVSLIRNTV
jgi:hypothetical protein